MNLKLMRDIEVICDADLRSGVTVERIEECIKKYTEIEDYEVCAGLKRSIEKHKYNQSKNTK